MATREGQAIRIALIIFAIIVVVLIGVCVYFSNGARALETDKATLQQEKKRLADKSETYMKENMKLRTFLGYKIDEKLETIQVEFNKNMLCYDESVPTTFEELNYRKLPKYYQTKLKELKGDLKNQQAQHTVLLAQKDATIKAEQGKLAKLIIERDTDIASIKDTLVLQGTKVKDQDLKIESVTTDIQETTRKHNEKLRELNDRLATAMTTLDKADRTINELKRKNRALRPENDILAKADGKIIRINSSRGRVTINLGSKHGLRRQTTFSVYDADVSNVATGAVKAKVEITQVDSTSSEARILNETIEDPILAGDQVYTVGWQPGQKLHFALAGDMDIDGDGRCDQKRLRNMIESVGSVVDGYVDGEGNTSGRVTNMTSYLIIGERPTEKSKGAAREAFTEFAMTASDNAVEQIQAERFIQLMGWEMGEQTITSGSSTPSTKTPPGVAPKSTGSTSGAFRKRTPAGSGR